MRNASLSAALAVAVTGSAFATISNQLIGDSYIVKTGSGAGAEFYSVLDVYIKCGASTDILASTFGVSAYPTLWNMNSGKSFEQKDGSGWKPVNDSGSAVDSYVTAGCRVQGSSTTNPTAGGTKAGFLQLTGDLYFPNFNTAGAGYIESTAASPGAGWYPAVGASLATNLYCRVGYYNSVTNVGKATTTIAGNNMVAGGSLDNAWMIGRFVIRAEGAAQGTESMTIKFATAGKNNGTTTVTGATNPAYRYNQTLTFATPAPGAVALLGLAGLVSRRRR